MTTSVPAGRFHWSNRLSFVFAASGSAVGLGNIWKFPYIAGQNGGGAFVMVYLAAIAMVGLPIFIAELYIGQKAQKDAVDAFRILHHSRSPFRIAGWMGMLSALLILSFYSVVGGWVLDFSFRALTNHFQTQDPEQMKSALTELVTNPWRQILWHGIFMTFTASIVMVGLKNGIERWNRILMPSLCVLIFLLLMRTSFLEGFGPALSFLFLPDFGKLSGAAILEAVGHAFFTLSLGMCAMITYGSYLKPQDDIIKTAATVALMDTVLALAAGIVVFAITFSFAMAPEQGRTLMFQTLPMLFSMIQGGYFVGVAFFTLVTFAALTSAVALLEVVISYMVDHLQMPRRQATIATAVVVFTIGILCALSNNVLSDFKIFGETFFDLFDKTTSHILMPVGGLLIAIFFGWVIGPQAIESFAQHGFLNKTKGIGLLWSLRIFAPVAIAIMLLNAIWN